MDFSAREHNDAVELVIELKNRGLGLHTYYAPIHARDIDHRVVNAGARQYPFQVRNHSGCLTLFTVRFHQKLIGAVIPAE